MVNAEPSVANTVKVLEVGYTYNGFGEPAAVTVVDPQPLQELEYSETYLERDAIGRVTKRLVDGAGIAPVEHSYTYHAQRGWLETHSKNGVLSDKWSYDQRGNRTGQKVGLTGQTTASHDAHDRLLQSGAETFGYDLQGRVVSRTGGAHNATYMWDAFGHLRHATLTPSQQSATDVEYRLDPAGRRIRSRALDANDIALEDHSWVYDGDLRVIAQLAANGKLKARYLYATLGHSPDVAVTFHPDSGAVTGVYLLVHDQVGSVVRTLDVADGSAVESVEYDAWGVATVAVERPRPRNARWRPATPAMGDSEMTTEVLAGLQQWYSRQCNGDWEHGFRIKISTLDNPGWRLWINLAETSVEMRRFQSLEEERSDTDWFVARVADGCFDACGGPHNLTEIIAIFLDWAEANGEVQGESAGNGGAGGPAGPEDPLLPPVAPRV